MAKKDTSTLTLRLNKEEVKRLDLVKKLSRETTSSRAIDQAIRSYPIMQNENYKNRERIEQLENELIKNKEVFDSLRIVIRHVSDKR